MADLFINKISKRDQYFLSMLLIGLVSLACFGLSAYIGYRVIAFILLLTVSLIAMVFDILPVLFSSLLTALVWDFFFIPPHFTLLITSTEDRIFFLMYFVIAVVNAVLTYKIRRVEKAARLKKEKTNTLKLYNTLFNSLSHELRTPIATIIAATDNLQTSNINLTTQHRQELIAEIAKASFRLDQQVENLLNMSRLESGFIKPKDDWCDISEVIYGQVKAIENSKTDRKIIINIDPELPLFRLDKGMLEQVIYNLLKNATTYTPVGSSIWIHATCSNDILQLKIEDNGPGFPVQELGHVFDKFYRLKNTSAGGTGLGLSIVKGFTEAMGGTATLTNKATGGAAFALNIPAATSYLKNLKNE